jgi:hypothetical protein
MRPETSLFKAFEIFDHTGFRDRRVTGVTRSGRQTSHNVTSGQSSGRRPRSAVAQDYLRNGDVTILKRHIAPRRLERSRSLCGLEIDRVSGQRHAVEVSTAEKFA